MHATFTYDDGKILKDGVVMTTTNGSGGNSGNDGDGKGAYAFLETDIDLPGDGKTYRFKIFDSGKTELWLTSCANGRHGSKNPATLGGVDKTLITTKIAPPKLFTE